MFCWKYKVHLLFLQFCEIDDSRLINILKATKATHIVNENSLVWGLAAGYIMKQTTELFSMFNRNTTLPSIRVGRRDDITMALCIRLNRGLLIGDGVLLVLCGHTHILGGRH